MKEEREATILSTPSNKEVRRTMKTREEVAHMLSGDIEIPHLNDIKIPQSMDCIEGRAMGLIPVESEERESLRKAA